MTTKTTAAGAIGVLAAAGIATAIVGAPEQPTEAPVAQAVKAKSPPNVTSAPPIENAGRPLLTKHLYNPQGPTPAGIVAQTEAIIESRNLCGRINDAIKLDASHPDPCTPESVDYRRRHVRDEAGAFSTLELCVVVIQRGRAAASGGRARRQCYLWSTPTPPGLASQIDNQLTAAVCPSADGVFGPGSCDPATVAYDVRHNRTRASSRPLRSLAWVWIPTGFVTEPAPEPSPIEDPF